MFRKRILYVTDDASGIEALRAELDTDFIPVDLVHAKTLEEARDKMTWRVHDMFLLDYCLEDGTGVSFCRELREAGHTEPILFYSALARDIDIEKALAAGCEEYLVRPDDVNRVVPAICRRISVGPVRRSWGPRRTAAAVL